MAANMGVGVETPSSGRTGVVFVLVWWLVPPLLYRHMAAGPDAQLTAITDTRMGLLAGLVGLGALLHSG